jgi:uncharacterized protein YjdB
MMLRSSRLVLALAALLLTACGGGGDPPKVASVAITAPATTRPVGQTVQLTATVRSDNGSAIAGRAITWSSSNGSVASVSGTGLVSLLSPGVSTISATADGVSGSTQITALPIPVASVSITPATPTVFVGQTITLSAITRDSVGGVLTGRSVSWSSNAPAIATITDAGQLTGVAPGIALVQATSEGRSTQAAVTVSPVPVASITVTAPSTSVSAGLTLQLSATLRDSAGGLISGRTPTWSTNNPAIATVSNTGLVTGQAAGIATITAAIDNRQATFAVAVTAGNGPVLVSVSPATLVPGQPAVLTGRAFAPTLAGNRLTIRGVSVPVTSINGEQLTFTVPCQNSGSADIRVSTDDGLGSPISAPITPMVRTLARGQSLIVTAADSTRCNELAGTGGTARYVVVVSSSATAANTTNDFELAGNTAAPGALVTRAAATAATARASLSATELREVDGHTAHLERERQLYVQLRSELSREPAPRPRANLAAATTPGEMRLFYFNYNACGDSTNTFRAKAVYVGARGIIWEDSLNTLQSANDPALASYYTRLGQIFDQDMYESVRSTFGDPLRRDAVLDNDGRVHLVFTQKVNGIAAGYVTSCDQAARNTTTRAASNFGEFTYLSVPTVAGTSTATTAQPPGWFAFMMRTVVHEVKHIASFSARFANNAPVFESGWLEEGTARHAEEVWARANLYKVAWKGNTGYGTAAGNGVFCDFNLANATCQANDPLRRPSWGMRRQFNEIKPKFDNPWNWSPYGDATGQSGAVFYQTVWSLVRYAIDRYGASDAQFLGALNQSISNGVTNLSNVAGVSMDRLIGGWGLALFADDYPGLGTVNPDASFATWNLRDIYASLNADPAWSSTWTRPVAIEAVPLTFGAFLAQRTGLRGGAHAFFEISGTPSAPQLLDVRAIGGGNPSSNLRIAIMRLQ